uniref:histidine phosphatase family protein n=1 Tax=Paenibacillus oryzisoli TaxID=1850517 RepID=UPI003D2B30EE
MQPLAQRLHVEIEIENRLAERVLSSRDLPDWLDHLRSSFHDLDKCLPGGESSRTAMQRIQSVVDELRTADHVCIAVVTHGNLMSLLLKHVDNRFGFEQWQNLSNPDIYCLSQFDAEPKFQRIWTSQETLTKACK